MKKIFVFLLLLFFINNIYSEYFKNKYSTEIDCMEPMTYRVSDYLIFAEDDIDLLKYKTIIRNGIIEKIENPNLKDFQLGVLTKTELKLLRNMFYAKKGYIFSDEDLTKYFQQFDWYKPQNNNVSFTDSEKEAIDKIKFFESESTIKYDYESRSILWEEFNGGADQRGPRLKLNKDKTFVYVPSEATNRLESITGTWTIRNNKIVLSVEVENIHLGGYIAWHPNTPYVYNAIPATIQFEQPVEITLPLNESNLYNKHNFTWGEKWIKIGSSNCYISE